jgi:hypothetical protein
MILDNCQSYESDVEAEKVIRDRSSIAPKRLTHPGFCRNTQLGPTVE